MKEIDGHLRRTRKPELLVVSPSSRFAGMPDDHTLHIWKSPIENIEGVKDIKMMLLHHTKGWSTLAFHPNDTIVAGGDVTGRILI
jgi:NET1-associated nuclear protein 1 (U3 small nucleolar RNA-associated protein 17)